MKRKKTRERKPLVTSKKSEFVRRILLRMLWISTLSVQISDGEEDHFWTQHKGTQTLSVEKSILATKIETKIRQYQIVSENTANPTKKKHRNFKYNHMAFEAIYGDRIKCKYFTGLYPEQFMILLKFLGPAKESLHYLGTKSSHSKVQKMFFRRTIVYNNTQSKAYTLFHIFIVLVKRL